MGRVLQFSDVHFGREHADAAAAAVEYAHATPNDLVLITGDITQNGYTAEFEAAARWIRAMPERVFVTVGNHDVPYWNVLDRLFWPWRRFERATGHPAHDHEFRSDGLMVRGVTTARGWQARLNWSKGVIDLDQTRRAAEALRTAPGGALRILACHHPLVEMIGTPMTGDVIRGEDVRRPASTASTGTRTPSPLRPWLGRRAPSWTVAPGHCRVGAPQNKRPRECPAAFPCDDQWSSRRVVLAPAIRPRPAR